MFFRSSLSIEMHQLHQLHCKFILVKICSDKESWDSGCFIKVKQKQTKVIGGELSKSYQVFQKERASVIYMCKN